MYQQMWLKSDACAVLKSELAKMKGNLDISNVVCLGLGSFCEHSRWSSHVQLAGLMTIISYLRKLVFEDVSSSSLICFIAQSKKIIAQDPEFNDLDEEFLNTFGIEVVDDPKAFTHIYETTFLYSFVEIQHVVTEITKRPTPAAMVMADVDVEEYYL